MTMKTAQLEPKTLAETLPVRAERALTLVAPAPAGERAHRLHMEAKRISLEHLQALQAALAQTHDLTQAVVDGGDLYVPGLHAFARQLAEELFWRGKTLEALGQRQRLAAAGAEP
jgi:hypothetical protein